MVDQRYANPEPVPPASQLAVLPFLAAVDGLLRVDGDIPKLRITIHRTMSRDGTVSGERDGYLQQVSAYVQDDHVDSRGKVGRIFPVTEGIVGAAFATGLVWRTKNYPTLEAFRTDLSADMRSVGDQRPVEAVASAYLAIPFLGPQKQVVLILYADCDQLNFFADDRRVHHAAAMCQGFCRLFDWLQQDPFSNLRNFPLQKGDPMTAKTTVYPSVQESVTTVLPPRFKEMRSFNYEAAVA